MMAALSPLTQEEVAAAVPGGDKALKVDAFVSCATVDETFLTRLTTSPRPTRCHTCVRSSPRRHARRQGRRHRQGNPVPARSDRAHTAPRKRDDRNDAQLRLRGPKRKGRVQGGPSAGDQGRDAELAQHINRTRSGTFDPRDFHDQYEAALAELVKRPSLKEGPCPNERFPRRPPPMVSWKRFGRAQAVPLPNVEVQTRRSRRQGDESAVEARCDGIRHPHTQPQARIEETIMPRPYWRGYLKLSLVTCPVQLAPRQRIPRRSDSTRSILRRGTG